MIDEMIPILPPHFRHSSGNRLQPMPASELRRWSGRYQAIRGWATHPWSAFRPEATEARRYLTCMRTRISSKGQIVLPAAVRQQDDIQPGQQFEVERVDRGEYRLRRCEPSPNQGLADWLLSCPEKGFFVEVDSESTDDL